MQGWASKTRLVRSLLSEALAFEAYYRSRPPRPFIYYLPYPLLFPYGFSIGMRDGVSALSRVYARRPAHIARLTGWQYGSSWAPGTEPASVYSLCSANARRRVTPSPRAADADCDDVVWYHSSFRRGRLVVVLLAGLISTSVVFYRVVSRRSPIISFATRERVALRTQASQRKAAPGTAQGRSRRQKEHGKVRAVEGDGAVVVRRSNKPVPRSRVLQAR